MNIAWIIIAPECQMGLEDFSSGAVDCAVPWIDA